MKDIERAIRDALRRRCDEIMAEETEAAVMRMRERIGQEADRVVITVNKDGGRNP